MTCFICKWWQEIRTRTFIACFLGCCHFASMQILNTDCNYEISLTLFQFSVAFSEQTMKVQNFSSTALHLCLALANQKCTWNDCTYVLSTNVGVRFGTLFSLSSAVDRNGLVCVFEFGEPRRPSTNTNPTEGSEHQAWRFLAGPLPENDKLMNVKTNSQSCRVAPWKEMHVGLFIFLLSFT